MAPPPAAAAATARSKSNLAAADARWLETVSDPELGLMMWLKELAVARASTAGHPHLADQLFHLRTLRALAFVLVQECKERLRQASFPVNTSMLDSSLLALGLNDPHPDPDPQEDANPMPMPDDIREKKRKQMKDGCIDGEVAQGPKKRKETREG